MKRCFTMIGAVALAAMVMTGCDSGDDNGDMQMNEPAMGAINDTCPVMEGSPVDASGGTAQYNGSTIGFCCAGCKGKWESMPDEEKQAFVNQHK